MLTAPSSTSTSYQPTPEKSQLASPQIVCSLEGNIGAGKTTFLNILNKKMEIKYVPEAVNDWQNVQGKKINLLELLYSDSERWGYMFQHYAFLSRLKVWEEVIPQYNEGILVTERCLHSDKYVFAKHSYNAKYFTNEEWVLYNEWFDKMSQNLKSDVDGFIYLKTSPEVCLERIQKRGRAEEKGLKLEFLKEIAECHDEWLSEGSEQLQIPVLVIDAERNFETDKECQEEIVSAVKNFISELEQKKLASQMVKEI